MRCEPVEAKRYCVKCFCTDDRACPGGCHWVGENLCSACAPSDEMLDRATASSFGSGGFFSDEYCPASATPALHAPLYLDANTGYCARCQQGFVE